MIKKVGGPRNFLLVNNMQCAVGFLLRYLVCFKSVPAILIGWGLETIQLMFGKWDGVANDIVNYEMLDYVEWKTGRRSEGVSTAVNGLLNKLVLNNIDMIVSNLAIMRTGFDVKLETNQPALYKKWDAIFFFLSPAFDNLVTLLLSPATLRSSQMSSGMGTAP